MKYLKKIGTKILRVLLKIMLPRKYFNVFYISDFMYGKYTDQLNLRQKIWCIKKGFVPEEYFAYNLEENDYKKYLPSLNNYQKASLNGRFNDILGNKLLFGEFIRAIITGIDSLHSIESLAYFEDGKLLPLNKTRVTGEYGSLVSCLEGNDLILKPIYGHQGKGVYLLRKDGPDYLLDDKKLRLEELNIVFRSLNNYLVQERFEQKGFSHEIYPRSLNTMRIGTMIDPATGRPFIAYAMHRFGSQESGFRDNYSQGGIVSMIDIGTGKLSEAKRLAKSGEINVFDIHPISNVSIVNKQIPNWSDLSLILTKMAGRMPYLKYVGWDIILSDNELYILEGNVCPGLDIVQMHKPFLETVQVRDFLKYYKYF